MPYLDAQPVPLPFGGKSATSKQASLRGAQQARVRAGSQASRMLKLYDQYILLSDTEMAKLMGLPEARISARRSGLMVRKLVEFADEIDGPHGVKVCCWTLTEHGARVARGLTE